MILKSVGIWGLYLGITRNGHDALDFPVRAHLPKPLENVMSSHFPFGVSSASPPFPGDTGHVRARWMALQEGVLGKGPRLHGGGGGVSRHRDGDEVGCVADVPVGKVALSLFLMF